MVANIKKQQQQQYNNNNDDNDDIYHLPYGKSSKSSPRGTSRKDSATHWLRANGFVGFGGGFHDSNQQ
jgi:hypothetical protein